MRIAYENGQFIFESSVSKSTGKEKTKNEREGKGFHFYDLLSDYTVIDIETTGLIPRECEIIEVAAVKVRSGKIVDTYESLIKPSEKISGLIEMLTGITNLMLSDAPLVDEVIPEFARFIGDDVIVGHNIFSFDSCFLYDCFIDVLGKPFSNNMIDTLYFSKKCKIKPDDYKLTSIAKLFGITYDAHRALNDCIANYQVYEQLKPLYDENMPERHTSKSGGHHKKQLSEKTIALAKLSALCNALINETALTDAQILDLHKWMQDNLYLSGNYPFDTIFEKLEEISRGGTITQEGRESLLSLLQFHSDPVKHRAEDCDADLTGKTICLTGEFQFGSRDAVAEVLIARGVTISKSVTAKTDYLIVGGEGSTAWACGNYGTKVKKALELQNKGKPIKIIREDVFEAWLNMTS